MLHSGLAQFVDMFLGVLSGTYCKGRLNFNVVVLEYAMLA